MTRNLDGTLNGDLSDNISVSISGSLSYYPSSSINENETVYDLLPVVVNRPPIITTTIGNASTPQIKPYASIDLSGTFAYRYSDDTIKVKLGSTFTLKINAEQPKVFNVENGIPKIISSSVGLDYVWRKDGEIVLSQNIASLQSNIIVSGSTLTFQNIQPEHAGAYVCEISNDIGTIVSETSTIEVLNLDIDSFFYKNLVQNPYGKNGTDNWESINNDFSTKFLSETPTQEFLKPYNTNLYGYTMDMMHPRPYQINMGVEQGFDMTKDLLNKGSYFTRTRYSYVKKGGSFLVRAYQDIDLTDIEPLIKGGVWGVDGVRAIFSCYIGNGVDKFVPTAPFVGETIAIPPNYYRLDKPRISKENFRLAGPTFGPKDHVYVTVEEFDNETKLSSRVLSEDGTTYNTNTISLSDPWFKRMGKYAGQVYIPSATEGNEIDTVLFVADELMADEQTRFTNGQYVEFNKVILNTLNPKTTKVRITINFETKEPNPTQPWPNMFLNDPYWLDASDEPLQFVRERPYIYSTFRMMDNDWNNYISNIMKVRSGKEYKDVVPLESDPRGMVTALNFVLLPVLSNSTESDYFTKQTLAVNNTKESKIITGLAAEPNNFSNPYSGRG